MHKRHDVSQRRDIVRQIPALRRPEKEERKRIEEDEDDEGDVGGHGGHFADGLRVDDPLGGEDAAAEDGEDDGGEPDEGNGSYSVVAVERCADGDFEGEAGGVVEEEGVLGGGAVGGRQARERLESAEVGVDGLVEEEEQQAEEGGQEAVEEVGGGETEVGGWGGQERQETRLHGAVHEADDEEGDAEHECEHDPRDHPRVAQEPGRPAVADGDGVDVG